MNTKDAIHILKERIDSPYTSDDHRLEILELFLTKISSDKSLSVEDYFKEMRRLVEYEE